MLVFPSCLCSILANLCRQWSDRIGQNTCLVLTDKEFTRTIYYEAPIRGSKLCLNRVLNMRREIQTFEEYTMSNTYGCYEGKW